jgi:uncharacterized protein
LQRTTLDAAHLDVQFRARHPFRSPRARLASIYAPTTLFAIRCAALRIAGLQDRHPGLTGSRGISRQQEAVMNAQENKQLVMQGYQMFANRDIQDILNLCADDIVWFGPENDHIPYSGSFHGKQGVQQFFTTMAAAQEYSKFEPKECIAENDRVVVIGEFRAQIRATGQTCESPWTHVFTVRDGKITSFQHLSDTAALEHAYLPMGAAAGAQPDTSLRH